MQTQRLWVLANRKPAHQVNLILDHCLVQVSPSHLRPVSWRGRPQDSGQEEEACATRPGEETSQEESEKAEKCPDLLGGAPSPLPQHRGAVSLRPHPPLRPSS